MGDDPDSDSGGDQVTQGGTAGNRYSRGRHGPRLLFVLFGLPEEINGDGMCPTYLYRWTVLKTNWWKVYLHHFVGDDWSRDLHDHPKRFVSIGLRGSYVEQTPAGFKTWRAPWLRTFPATHIHRITVGPSKSCWSLVIVFRSVRQWGFWHEGKFINWLDYVRNVGGIAERMKSCD